MAERGRPTKLTPEVQARVVTAISGGNTRETAASYAGIRRATLFEWLARGRAARSGLFRDFADAIEKAEADASVTSVGLIRRAAQTSWQAAAWWLERRYPDEWGRKDGPTAVATASASVAVIKTVEPPLGL